MLLKATFPQRVRETKSMTVEGIAHLGSDFATIFLALAAIVGGWFAYRQFKGAEDARTASLYIALYDSYTSIPMNTSKRNLHHLADTYKHNDHDEPLDQFVDTELRQKRRDEPKEYSDTVHILTFLEYIGVLVNHGLIKREIIFDFMGGNIQLARNCLKKHIEWCRQHTNEPHLLANTLTLMEMLQNDLTSDTLRSKVL